MRDCWYDTYVTIHFENHDAVDDDDDYYDHDVESDDDDDHDVEKSDDADLIGVTSIIQSNCWSNLWRYEIN